MTRVPISKRQVGDTHSGHSYWVGDALAFDNSLQTLTKRRVSAAQPVTFDLSALKYVHHEILLYAGALIRFRALHGYSTLIELPKSDTAWNYLRTWKFPEFISSVAEAPFSEMLTPKSRKRYEADRHTFPIYAKVIDLPGGGVSELLPTEHFQITPIDLNQNPFDAAMIAQDSWLEGHVRSILDAYLAGEGERVGSLVILEAVLNAAMHPQATMAFTSSQIVLPDLDAPERSSFLQISIWDDGLPLAMTLRSRLDQGLGIKSPAFGEYDETFVVRLVRSNGREEVKLLKSTDDALAREFPWLTVAAFMAGISALPDRLPRETGGGVRDANGSSNQPGMGLRYIRRNVLDLWGGQIRYWSNNYRFSMTALDQPDRYEVTVLYRPKDAWTLQGNLLYLDIPLAQESGIGGL